MSLKPGTTSYRQHQVIERRHQRPDLVGDNYGDRQKYQAKRAEVEASGNGFLGKIRDFFLGPKLPNVHEFAPQASYVSGVKAADGHRMIEQGIRPAQRTSDGDLFAILDEVQKIPPTK